MIDFKNLLESLNRERVEMVIVGGLAAIVHGSSLITNDLDICYQRKKDNYKKITRALQSFNPLLRGPKGQNIPFLFDEKTIENGLNFTLTTTGGDIDLLGELQGLGIYESIRSSAEKIQLFGMEFLVISLDDLIKAKRSAGRKKDLIHLDDLEALREMKKRKS